MVISIQCDYIAHILLHNLRLCLFISYQQIRFSVFNAFGSILLIYSVSFFYSFLKCFANEILFKCIGFMILIIIFPHSFFEIRSRMTLALITLTANKTFFLREI